MNIEAGRIRKRGLAAALLIGAACARAEDSAWVDLFNGKDLKDWDLKFSKHQLDDNFNNTFKVEDSVLSVDYSAYGNWGGEWGHAANKLRPWSYYLLRADYQVGLKQVSGGPSWALENNGLMLHSQSMASMTLNQDYPISLEMQLLGADNKDADNNSNLNLCTPGTAFYTAQSGGSVNTAHCTSAATGARAKPGGDWTWVSASVMGDSIIRFYLGPSPTGTPVMTFYRPVYYAGNVSNPPANTPANGTPLKEGYISIQAETYPYKFRKIQVLDLEGCMDISKPAYRSYFVKSKAGACDATTRIGTSEILPKDVYMTREREGFAFRSPVPGTLQVANPSGKVLVRRAISAGIPSSLRLAYKGVCLVTWRSATASARLKWTAL